ncbi:MAG: ABC transporter ATP-binding protein [Chloroflexi bacterium HGW-Chloroflexi-4]|jgi:putative ABC transport system ATP-binding protein|nr:MAG: ABC transporter ATP-binding protein [Chloroflexi bacterium HGW-Chloroflexi-4]
MARKSTLIQKDKHPSTQSSEPLINVSDVVKSFKTAGEDFFALNGITFNVYPGEFLGIIGKSGAGKTTLVNMITGVDHLTSGQVSVNTNNRKVSIHHFNEDQLALWRGQNMGVVYQSFQLLPMLSLLENIMLPMDLCGNYSPSQSREKAYELLRMVELEDHAKKLPKFISGGQQQRVSIARALANDPPIIIADEPTGSLDSITADHVFGVFETLKNQGRTILMVTHDKSLSPRFTRTLVIQDGELAHDSQTEAM